MGCGSRSGVSCTGGGAGASGGGGGSKRAGIPLTALKTDGPAKNPSTNRRMPRSSISNRRVHMRRARISGLSDCSENALPILIRKRVGVSRSGSTARSFGVHRSRQAAGFSAVRSSISLSHASTGFKSISSSARRGVTSATDSAGGGGTIFKISEEGFIGAGAGVGVGMVDAGTIGVVMLGAVTRGAATIGADTAAAGATGAAAACGGATGAGTTSAGVTGGAGIGAAATGGATSGTTTGAGSGAGGGAPDSAFAASTIARSIDATFREYPRCSARSQSLLMTRGTPCDRS
jgi:hypothetical protein